MLRDICNSDWGCEPLHFYQVDMAVKFNDAIDLLDDPMAGLGHLCEGFTHEDAICLEESIQNPFKEFAPFVGVIHCEQAIEVLANCLYVFLLSPECLCLTALVFQVLACLRFTLLAHPSERVLYIDDASDTGNQTLRLKTVFRPACRKVLILDHTLQNFSTFPEGCFSGLV